MRLEATDKATGMRLDLWLAEQLPEISRSRVQSLIKAGNVTVAGIHVKSHAKVFAGMTVEIEIPQPAPMPELAPEDIPIEILYEDADLVALNKPAGLVVHPGAGHSCGTLVNALLFRCRDLAGIRGELRPGIVHRLDRDTSGVMIVAKNDVAMERLANQFKKRLVRKEYLAVLFGILDPPRGRIETMIGRSAHDRKKMSINPPSAGRVAITNYETLESFREGSLALVSPETGRTHQIRVHMAHIGHPIIGDKQYGRGERELEERVGAQRQMLHARRLLFNHPSTDARMEISAEVPADMKTVLDNLRNS